MTAACGRLPLCHKYRAQSPVCNADKSAPASSIALYNRITSSHGERITAVHLVTMVTAPFDDDACVHADIRVTVELLPVAL